MGCLVLEEHLSGYLCRWGVASIHVGGLEASKRGKFWWLVVWQFLVCVRILVALLVGVVLD